MIGLWLKVIVAVVIASILVLVAYYSYNQYQCQSARQRYEDAAFTLSETEISRYLNEYQQACKTTEK